MVGAKSDQLRLEIKEALLDLVRDSMNHSASKDVRGLVKVSVSLKGQASSRGGEIIQRPYRSYQAESVLLNKKR